MTFEENVPLAPHTTFRIGGAARYFCRAASEAEVVEAVRVARERRLSLFILGGGSNVLIADAGYAGVALKMEERGISFQDDGGEVVVSAAAGVPWDDLVESTVQRGLFGLENLSAIPGTVGAAPVQNIGAYGAEVSQVIHKIRACDTQSLEFVEFNREACRFGYRDSLFKQLRRRYIITRVDFRLRRNGSPWIAYQDLARYFAARGCASPALSEVRQAVVEVRQGKLPDLRWWGTAGSYFKNPIVTAQTYEELKRRHPRLPGHAEPDGRMKLPLGWILDQLCGARGLALGKAGTYEKQALVIVTQPGASSDDVRRLERELARRVREVTGIEIEPEVEWVQ
jgi:UDP-N-acetylmuramate dehydrogenase